MDREEAGLEHWMPLKRHRDYPTCVRCQQQFATWSNFKYHIQFARTKSLPTQELMMEQEERRLKVTELLTYVTSNRLEALQHDQRLKEYFTKHCALCSQVCLTARGFLHHWSTQHHDLYTQHGLHYDRLHDSVLQASPCLLCDAHYQQQHACVMIRQIALIVTQQDAAPPPAPHVTPRTWKRQQRQKAYTTQHGLKEHLRLYHTATQAVADLTTDTDTETLQCVWQAVAQEQYEHIDILTNDSVIQLLTTRCILCSKRFNHQRYLTRHLRDVSDRENMDKHAILLDNMHKTGNQCYCTPRHPQRRHIRTIFNQLALMRLQHTRAHPGVEPTRPIDDAAAVTLHMEPTFLESLTLNPHAARIPHALVTSDKMVRIALALGNPDFLRHHREHRGHLTMQRQLCLEVCPHAEETYEHLQDIHQVDYDAGQPILNMLYWAVFKQQGCCCNPGPSWHSGPHVCIPLLQAAMLFGRQPNHLVIPWQFKVGELLRVLDGILMPDDMYDLAFAMLIRRFDYLATDERLRRALQDRCLLCRALIEHDSIEAHLQQVHPDLGLGPTLIYEQLGCAGWTLLQDLGFRRQLSISLAFPKWHSLISNDDNWPSTDQVLQHLQLCQLIMSQNTAPISALQDPQLTITEAGFLLLDDPWMTDVLKYRCTICHATIFQPSHMLKHLQAHNMYQYDTHCNLQFLMDCAGDPCYFCDLAHPAECRDQCVPALKVAIHTSYVTRRRDELHLVQPFVTGSIGNVGQSGQGIESSITQAQQKAEACSRGSGDQDTRPAYEESHHLGLAPRGHTECHDVRASTGLTHASGSRQHCAGDAEGQSGMASRGHKRGAIETPTGMHHDDGLERSPCDLEPGPTDSRLVQGLHQVQPGGLQWRDALPSPGPEGTEASAHKRQSAVPCSEKARGLREGQIHPLAVDSECPTQPRDLARTPAHVLSCHLATHSDTNSSPIPSQIYTGQDFGGEPEEMKGLLTDKIIRILVNTTGAMRYVNCFTQGLAWQTLQSTSLDADSWATSFGFLLIMAMTLFTPEPLNLRNNQFFLDALSRGWSLTALGHQHDMIEFAGFMMNALKPCFVDDRWGTLPFLRGSSHLGDTHLWAEKGDTHTHQHQTSSP